MKMFVLPQEKIYVDGFTDLLTWGSSSASNQNSLEVGDMINLTCVSGASKPPPKMAWFINGEMVRAEREGNAMSHL
jgi:hypothetical protein